MTAPTDAIRLAARVRPAQRAVMRQRWSHLLFLHWAWDSDVVQRTLPYVYDAQGRPGVWFYSLDANQWLAVKVARSCFHLPHERRTRLALGANFY
jgi:uncharacterized protein